MNFQNSRFNDEYKRENFIEYFNEAYKLHPRF